MKTKYIIGYDDGDGKSNCGVCVMKNGKFIYSSSNRKIAKFIIYVAKLFNQTLTIEK